MTFDWTIKFTDIVMIITLLSGPTLAVRISEKLRDSAETRRRRIHIFRTLMATRSASLSPAHIEALNLVEIEFYSRQSQDRKVVDCWRLYLVHLNDRNYPRESWAARKDDLLFDLLHEMSLSLRFSYDKSQIKSGTYYPIGWQEAEAEQIETRKLWLQILQGKKELLIKNTPPPPPGDPPTA
jgi:hypothetical protein